MSDPRDATDTRSRSAGMEEAFEMEIERAPQLPAAIQQVMIDDRPQGAIKVPVKRDLQEVLRNIKTIATAAGDDFFYSWPTKNKDGTQGVVEGPSVKCANAVSRIFGNCSVRVRAFDQGPHWIFYAQFYDMETGFVYERPFQQRKGQNIGGKMDKDRAADIVFQIGVSKAARNAVCNALSEFTDYAFDVAKEQLVEKIGRNLPKFLDKIRARLAELKVDPKRVEAIRGKAMAAWTAPDAAKVIAEIQAVADGMAHPDEIWPMQEAGAARPQESDAANEPPAAQAGAQAAPAAETAKPAAAEPAQATAAAAPAEPAPAAEAAQEPAQAASEPDPDAARQEAYDQASAYVLRLVDQLAEVRPGDLAGHKARVQDALKAWEGLDEEDLAVVMGRWNAATLEAERANNRSRTRKPK